MIRDVTPELQSKRTVERESARVERSLFEQQSIGSERSQRGQPRDNGRSFRSGKKGNVDNGRDRVAKRPAGALVKTENRHFMPGAGQVLRKRRGMRLQAAPQ